MSTYAISLSDYRPSPRYLPVATPWTQAQIAYAATLTGPFTPFDTIALTPLDADPALPALRNVTTLLSPAPSGFFEVTFLDAAGNQEPTVPVQFPASTATFTYTGDPSSSDQDAVRFEISDTDPGAPLLQDTEIVYALSVEAGSSLPRTQGGIFNASARCLEVLARRFAAQADQTVGSLKVEYSKQALTYAQRAAELRSKAQGLHAPYAGGLSISEKQAAANDQDLVQPAFSRDQFRNPYSGPRIPQFPVSNEQPP